MTKEEAKASVREMANMMEFFEGTCELCGGMRKDCSAECVEKQLEYNKKEEVKEHLGEVK